MHNEAPSPKSVRKNTLIVLVGGVLFLLLIGWVAGNSKRIQIWYHTRQMNSGWKETHSKSEDVGGGLTSYVLGEGWKRYETSRDMLVELGTYRHVQYQFQALESGSRECRHLQSRLILQSTGTLEEAPSLYWESSEPSEGFATMKIWGTPVEVQKLLADLKEHDVADYKDRFRKPAVLAQAREFVEKWPTLGMWLPDSREIDFFRDNYDFTRDILKKEIRNTDPAIRRNALYVVGELEGAARELGPDLVELLAATPAAEPNLSAVRALTAIRFRSPDCQAQLARHWDAVADQPEIALVIAAAQYALSESHDEQQRAEAYIIQWLQPVPEGLDESKREAYFTTQLEAVMCVKVVRGFKSVEAPLERLLAQPAKMWMNTQIPDAMERVRRPVEEAAP